MATQFSFLSFAKIGQGVKALNANAVRTRNIETHLSVCSRVGLELHDFAAPLLGYCPGRPPKHGVLALAESQVIFCQKTKLGDLITDISLSHISAVRSSRLMKQNLITIHTAGLNFEFASRTSQDDIMYFLSLLRLRVKNQI